MSGTYAGSFSGSGAGVVQLGSLNASGLTLDFASGGAQWTSDGTLTGTLTNAGSIVVDSGVTVYQGSLSSGASIINQAGATFDLQGTADLSNEYINGNVYNGGTFTNAGTLEQSTGTGTATIAYAITDTGTIVDNSGTLSLTGGGSGRWCHRGCQRHRVRPHKRQLHRLLLRIGLRSRSSYLTLPARGAGVTLNFTNATWTSGSLMGLVTNTGTLAVTTSGLSLTGTLTNAGLIVVDSGVTVYQGSTSSGSLDHQPGRCHLRPTGHRQPQQRLR